MMMMMRMIIVLIILTKLKIDDFRRIVCQAELTPTVKIAEMTVALYSKPICSIRAPAMVGPTNALVAHENKNKNENRLLSKYTEIHWKHEDKTGGSKLNFLTDT